MKARTNNFYGMKEPPTILGETWIESETFCKDYGQFTRRGLVRYKGGVVAVKASIPDTFFSIPATTNTEHGYVTSKEENGKNEFIFVPHTEQTETPVEWRKQYKKDCR